MPTACCEDFYVHVRRGEQWKEAQYLHHWQGANFRKFRRHHIALAQIIAASTITVGHSGGSYGIKSITGSGVLILSATCTDPAGFENAFYRVGFAP